MKNKISDINILEKVDFKELKELNLSLNKISNINVLEKVDFAELKELNLSFNNISDKNVLKKVNFKVIIKNKNYYFYDQIKIKLKFI